MPLFRRIDSNVDCKVAKHVATVVLLQIQVCWCVEQCRLLHTHTHTDVTRKVRGAVLWGNSVSFGARSE